MENLIAQLAGQIPTPEYELHIAQLKFNQKASDENQLVFNAPNELIAKFISTRYAEKLAYAYEVKTGKKARVIIQGPSAKKTSKNIKSIDPVQLKARSSTLNPAYTFASFVQGDSNHFAYSVCKMAAENPGNKFNPIFIYGPTGLGKTHLLQSVGNECLENGKVVIYVTSEQFITDFTEHIKNHNMQKFKDKYRNCDVLLIDDVQFLGKTEKIQEEFFHTFNELHSKNGQIVMTSDRPPKTLKGFEERLTSRFEGGLIADITPPDLETKIIIIQKKCEFNEIMLSRDIIDYIATNMGTNIREIEGTITEIAAYARMIGHKITLEFAKNIIKNRIKERLENVSLEDIISVISRELNIKPSEIKSKSRVASTVKARRIVIYLAKTLTPNSMPQIANYFGMKDHSAVSHSIKKINELLENEDEFAAKIEELKNKIVQKDNM